MLGFLEEPGVSHRPAPARGYPLSDAIRWSKIRYQLDWAERIDVGMQ